MRDRGAVRPPTEVDADALTGGEVEAITYLFGAHVNYHLPDVAGGSPYLSLGAGREAWEYNVEGGEIESQSTLFAGGGVDVRLRGVLRDSPRCQGLDLEAEVAG